MAYSLTVEDEEYVAAEIAAAIANYDAELLAFLERFGVSADTIPRVDFTADGVTDSYHEVRA